MHGNIHRTLALLALLCLASCRATSYPYHFEPSPAEVQVAAAPDGPLLARVLVGVVGAERHGAVSSGHPDLLVRLRIEAKGPGPVRFDPASARVLGPDLASFGPARVDGVDGHDVPVEAPVEAPVAAEAHDARPAHEGHAGQEWSEAVGEGVAAPGVIVVPADGARDLTLRFAFPKDGDLRMWRLTGINVSLTLDTLAGSKELTVALTRSQSDLSGYPYGYPYGYGYPYWGWHVGFVYGYDC